MTGIKAFRLSLLIVMCLVAVAANAQMPPEEGGSRDEGQSGNYSKLQVTPFAGFGFGHMKGLIGEIEFEHFPSVVYGSRLTFWAGSSDGIEVVYAHDPELQTNVVAARYIHSFGRTARGARFHILAGLVVVGWKYETRQGAGFEQGYGSVKGTGIGPTIGAGARSALSPVLEMRIDAEINMYWRDIVDGTPWERSGGFGADPSVSLGLAISLWR